MNFDEAFRGIGQLLGLGNDLDTVAGIRGLLGGVASMTNTDLPDVGGFIEGITYREVDGLKLTLDITIPKGDGPFPVMVYLHGGAWVWGSPATHRKLTHRFAEEGFLVMSVDYRLAPEHPFPAGFNDCLHAIHFAAHNAATWAGDKNRLVVAGDSAGGNLAAAACIALADDPGAPAISGVGLLYGVYDFRGFQNNSITKMLVDAYLGERLELLSDPRVSPILKAQRLPPAHIMVGTGDDLMSDARALKQALDHSAGTYEYREYEDMPHAFVQMEILDSARPAIKNVANYLLRVVPSGS